jgi:two-component system response regulator AtoC
VTREAVFESVRVLVVDDEPDIRLGLRMLLAAEGLTVAEAADGAEALREFERTGADIVLTDLQMPGMPGTELLAEVKRRAPATIAVVLTGFGTIQTAVWCIQHGAAHFLTKPFDNDELVRLMTRLARQVLAGRRERRAEGTESVVAEDPRMQRVMELVRRVAPTPVPVLVEGETGTGKDVVARAIHQLSSRRTQPFVKVNCAAMPRELLESELFGHERGAFTGAHQTQPGKFELANRGTIFLDEIGDLHPALQAKLLHVLQDGTFSRVGGRAPIQVDVRVLAATNRDIEREVEAGRFREDLYYRLNVIQIVVPPLRDRMEELPLLATHFAQRYGKLFHREGFVLAPGAMERLARHRFPGNVRELENLVKRMIVLDDPGLERTPFLRTGQAPNGDGHRAAPEAAVANGGSPPAPRPPVVPLKEVARAAARAAEREAIVRVLDQTGWNRVRAAKLLKISYRALLYKIKEVGLGPVPESPATGQ